MPGAAPPLAADLTEGLRRLKLAAMRRLAPELLLTAKTQRWAPEELLRTLVEAEISARDASNARTRLKNAAFPVAKTLEEFDLGVSSVPPATFAYLASLEWIPARENLCLVGPAGTGKSHLLVALGAAAIAAAHKVRYFTAAELTAGPRSRRPPRPGHRQPLPLRVLGPVRARAHHRRQPARPPPAPRQRRGHRRRLLPHRRSQNQERNHPEQDLINPRGGDF